MKIYIKPSTAGRSGGTLNGNLTHFNLLLQHELEQAGFMSSFNELHIGLYYPPLYLLPGVAGIELDFMKYYETLPDSRLYRKTKYIPISLKAPEFSEHFDKAKQASYKKTFDISPEYQNIPETELAKILIDKFAETLTLIKPKIKKGDVFDFGTFEKVLKQLKEKITPEFLSTAFREYGRASYNNQLTRTEQARDDRRSRDLPKDKLIRDIRPFFDYQLPVNMFYLNRYADVVLQELIRMDFKCPVYHHLYISIADTREEALKKVFIVEDWYTFGIAVLPKDRLFQATPEDQQFLVLNAIRDGLMDIATMDNLDTDKVLDAIQTAKATGVLSERVFKAKENNRIAFVISTKTIAGTNKEDIYFTLIDKQNDRTAHWKFGEENIFVIGGWFGTITVTNKVVRTKPRAHMDLVLKGKQQCLEIDVEKTLADPGSAIRM